MHGSASVRRSVHSWPLETFLVVALCALLAPAARAQDTQQNTMTLAIGDAQFQVPASWKHAATAAGSQKALVVAPPDVPAGEKLAIMVLASNPLKGADFKSVFAQVTTSGLSGSERIQKTSDIKQIASPPGYTVLTRSVVVGDDAGHLTLRIYFGANPNDRLEVMVVIASPADTAKRYQTNIARMVGSFTFGHTPDAGSPAPETSVPAAAGGAGGSSAALGRGAAIRTGLWINVGPVTASADGSSTGPNHIKDVAIDATNHTIYVAAVSIAGGVGPRGGLFAGTNGGRTWQRLYAGDCTQVVPTATDRMYALTSGSANILVSDDRGRTWRRRRQPTYLLYGGVNNAEVQCLGVSPAAPNVIYAGASGVHGGGLYKSIDGGQTWRHVSRRAAVRSRDGSATDFHDGDCDEIAVDPADPNLLYARFEGFVLQSRDGGQTLFDCAGFHSAGGPATRDAVAIKVIRSGAVAMDPALPNFAYFRTREAIYRTGDSGQHWTRVTIPDAQFVNTIVEHPGSPQIVYAATSNGIMVSNDAGTTWRALKSGDAPRSAGAVEIPYVFNGTAFNSVMTVVSEDEPVVVDPATNHVLYGTAGGLKVLVPVK